MLCAYITPKVRLVLPAQCHLLRWAILQRLSEACNPFHQMHQGPNPGPYACKSCAHMIEQHPPSPFLLVISLSYPKLPCLRNWQNYFPRTGSLASNHLLAARGLSLTSPSQPLGWETRTEMLRLQSMSTNTVSFPQQMNSAAFSRGIYKHTEDRNAYQWLPSRSTDCSSEQSLNNLASATKAVC